MAGMALVVCALVGFWLWRDGRFLAGTAGKVAAILRDVRREENRQNGSGRLIDRLRTFLPGPLDDLVDRVFPQNWVGEYEFTQRLVVLGTNAVPSLLTTVEFDRSVTARRVAARGLADLRATQATPLLVRVLRNDSQVEVRAAMAQALSEMNDTNAIPGLMEALEKDVASSVQTACAGALGDMRVRSAGPLILRALENNPDTMERATKVRALRQLGYAPAVPVLIGMLKPPAQTPGSSGSSVSFQSGYIQNDLRAEVARALGAIGGDVALEALIDQLAQEKESPVGEAICEVLGVLGGPRAVAALRSRLVDECDFRAAAVAAWGTAGDVSMTKDFVALFADRDEEVRAAAVAAVGVIGDASALATLRRFLPQESADRVRSAGCKALALLGDASDQALVADTIQRMKEPEADAIWAAGYLGNTNSVALLTDILKHSQDNTARFAAAYGLVLASGAAARQALKENLSDKDEFARHGKACALLMLGDDGGLKTVRSSLRTGNDWQRFGATLAVERSGLESTPELLAAATQDSVEEVRRFMAGARSGRASATLIELLQTGDDSYRHYAARALVYYQDTNAVPALRAACKDSEADVREAARLTLRRIEREQKVGISP